MDFKDFKDYEIHNYKKETKWEAFKWEVDWNWNNYLVLPIKRFKTGVKNLWVWRKIIWNDRWYDHSFLHTMLREKLHQMEQAWEGAHYVGSEDQKQELGYLVVLLDEIDKQEELCTIEADKIVSELYEEFGRRLFQKRQFTKYGETSDKNTVITATLMEILWD